MTRSNEGLPASLTAEALIAASPNLQNVLQITIQEMLNLLSVEECVIFYGRENDSTVTLLAASDSLHKPQIPSTLLHAALTDFPLLQQVLLERRAQQVTLSQALAQPAVLAQMQADGIKTLFVLPMECQDQVVGAVQVATRQAERDFTIQEVALAQLLANQTAIAIENAHLYIQTERRAQQLAVLHELDRAISATLHLDDIYHAFARHTTRLLPYDRLLINLLEGDHILVAHMAAGDNSGLPAGARFPVKSSATGWVIAHGQPMLRHNIPADTRFAEDEQLVAAGIQSGMVIPLRFKREVIGAWLIGSQRRGAYTPDDLEIAQAIADQLANAIENARLYKQARQEIAERKQAEAALRASEERFRQVISSISDWIYVTSLDEDGTKVNLYLSPHVETLTGYPYETFLADWSFWPGVVIHPDDRATAAEQTLRLAQGQNSETEYRLTRADGEIVWVRDSARIETVGASSKIIYGVVSDITQRKQLEAQFLQAQKMEAVGRLAGGVAHDFNNLLTVINGYSELLLQRYLDERDPLRRYIEEMKKAGERAAALTGQLLAFSRKQVLQPKILDLNEVVADLEKMLRRLIGEDIELVTKPGARLGRIKADPGQIEQVLLNLVVNARDAMPGGGKLTIETANVTLDEAYTQQRMGLEPGRYVMLAVKDTGTGIEPDILPHIFEPFFTTKGKFEGTGLGLATVYGIMTQSNGYIDVSSQVGTGTTFKFFLPEVDQTIEPAEQEQMDEGPHGHETVLLVEDEASVRELTRTILLKHGYHVLEAASGREAILLSQQHQGTIELLATDVVMPQMSGPELAERLLKLRPQMKVLYMSGYTEDTILYHGVLETGVVFLQKPFTPTRLAHKVREILDG
jgi:PAS domain S-box-containing protein